MTSNLLNIKSLVIFSRQTAEWLLDYVKLVTFKDMIFKQISSINR